jgi:hypothetical protein
MIAIAAQTWLALGMIALAALYLARCAWRALRGQSAGPGCCSTGCSLASPDPTEPKPEQARGNFIPLENLADLARRRKEESDH